MLWNRIVPPGGGGALRRFLRLRQDLLQKKFPSPFEPFEPTATTTSTAPSSAPDTRTDDEREVDELRIVPMSPLSLFDFGRTDDAADAKAVTAAASKGGWRLSDDGVIGGYSTGSAVFHGPMADGQGSGGPDVTDRPSAIVENAVPFLRWEGTIDTRIPKRSRVKRSGFCAVRSPDCSLPPFSYGVPFGSHYNALEIRCRTDGRMYAVNLKVSTYMEDDLYQGFITVGPEDLVELVEKARRDGGAVGSVGDWMTVVMPFRDFVLTSSGRERVQQRALDGGITFQHLGFTLMDKVDGPFQFDLARIRAVNYDDGKILNDD